MSPFQVFSAIGSFVARAKAVASFVSTVFTYATVLIGIKNFSQAKDMLAKGQDILANKTAAGGKIPVIYGRRRVGAQIVYMDTASNRSKDLFIVYALSVGECEEIEGRTIELDGNPITDPNRFRDGSYIGSDKINSGAGSLNTADQVGTNNGSASAGGFGTNPAHRYRAVFNLHHGAATQTADPMLVASVGSEWTSAHKLNGITYIAASYEYDTKAMFKSVPQLTVVVKGQKVYDPREDSTVTGGSGSQRLATPSTYAWNDNAACCFLNYLTNDQYGKGLTASDLDLESFRVAAVLTDTLVDTPDFNGSYASTTWSASGGSTPTNVITFANESQWSKYKLGDTLSLKDNSGNLVVDGKTISDIQRNSFYGQTQQNIIIIDDEIDDDYDDEVGTSLVKSKRFHCNGVIDTNKNVMENAKELLGNMRGILNYVNGKYELLIEDTGSSQFTVTDDHIIDGISIDYGNKDNRANKVVVEFFNGAQGYEQDTATVYHNNSSSTYKNDDGGEELEVKVSAPLAVSPYVAWNMGKAVLERSRYQTSINFMATPELYKVNVGSIITVNYAGLGLSSKLFRIETMDLQADGLISISAIEYIDIYTWQIPPVESVPPKSDPPTGFELVVPTGLVLTDTSANNPRAYLSWTANLNYPVDSYRVIVLDSNSNSVINAIVNSNYIYLDLLPVGSYNATVTAINSVGTESNPSSSYAFSIAKEPIATDDVQDNAITNVKVNDLSAVKINTGELNLGTASGMAVKQAKSGYTDNTTGFWLGNDGGTPKFNIGTSTNHFKFDGTGVSIKGALEATALTIDGNATITGTLDASHITVDGDALDTLLGVAGTGANKVLSLGYDAKNKLEVTGTHLKYTTYDQVQANGDLALDMFETSATFYPSASRIGWIPTVINAGGQVTTRNLELNSQTTPTYSTSNLLYNVGGALYWNGNAVGTGNSNITSIVAGTNLNGGGSSGTVTLNLDSTITGNHTFSNNVIIGGDLTVQGTTVTVDTTNLDVKDKNITLNYSTGDSSASANGAGITIQDAVSAGNDATLTWNTANDSFNFSHNLNFADNVKAQFGASNDLQIFHDQPNSINYIKSFTSNELRLESNGNTTIRTNNGDNMAVFTKNGAATLYHDNNPKIATTSTGIDVTGNIVVSGTVDGRDIATDGTKLDGIEAGATTDQTQAEINALGITATGLSGTPNITVGTINSGAITTSGTLTVDAGSNGMIDFGNVTAAYGRLYADSTGTYIGSKSNHSLFLRTNNQVALSISTDRKTTINSAYTLPNYAGNAGQALRLPLSGTELEWYTLTSFPSISVSGTATVGALDIPSNGTNDTRIEIGTSTLASHYAYIDLVGDTTYTDYGIRLIRNNGGANTSSRLIHRGTDSLFLEAQDAGSVVLKTNGSDGLTINSSQNATFAGTLTLSSVANDTINFSGSTTNDQRGISFDGKPAVTADSSDGWLRLNANQEFSNGIYTPANLRVDGNINVNYGVQIGGTTVIDASRNLTNISSLNVNHSSNLSGTQVYIKKLDASTNLQRWGEGTGGQSSYRFRIDQFFNFIANSGSGDNFVLDSSTGNVSGVGTISSGNVFVGKTNNALANDGVVIRDGGEILATNTNDLSGNFNRLGSDGGIISFYKDSATVGSIGVIHGNNLFIGGTSHSGLQFGTSIIYPTGGTGSANDATVDLGGSATRFKDLYLSGTARSNTVSINGTTVIDASRNLTNIGTIGSGRITSNSGSAHNYLGVFASGSNEAMTYYNNDTSNSWFIGIRNGTSNGVSNTGYHIYSNATGNTVCGWNSDGTMVQTYNATFAGTITKTFDVGNSITLGNDGTFGTSGTGRYVTLGFSGTGNGASRIFSHNTGQDSIYLAAATGHGVIIRANGSGTNHFRFTSTGTMQVNNTTILNQSRDLTNIGTISSGAITSTGNSVLTGSSSSGSAFVVNRGSDGAYAFTVQNTGDVLIQASYLYVVSTAGSYFQHVARFRGGIQNDVGGAPLLISDNLNVDGIVQISGTTVIDASRNLTNIGNLSLAGDIYGTGNFDIRSTGNIYNTYGNSSSIFFRTQAGATKLTLDANGNVGIGITPSNTFSVGASGTVTTRYTSTDTSAFSLLQFENSGSIVLSADHGNSAANSNIIFKSDGATERMRIDSSGNVKINNTRTTAVPLHVVGGTASGTMYDVAVFAGGQNSTSGSGAKIYLTGCENDPTARGTIIEGQMTDNGNSHALIFHTSGNSQTPTERMRIDALGNVGIGSSNPTSNLGWNRFLEIAGGSSNAVIIDGTDGQQANVGSIDGMYIDVYGHSTATNNNIIFRTQNANGVSSGIERMRIDSGGNIKHGASQTTIIDASRNLTNIGTGNFAGAVTATDNVLTGNAPLSFTNNGSGTFNRSVIYNSQNNTSNNVYNGITIECGRLSDSSTAEVRHFTVAARGGQVRFKVDANSNGIFTGDVQAYSDERLKDNIQTLDGKKALQMRGVSFTRDGRPSSGVIAQEVEKIAPELVMTAEDEMGTKSVAYGNLVGYLIETVKDQQAQIDELKAMIEKVT